MGADIDWQTAAGFNANWSGFSDTDSGIAEYEYAIGTVTGGTDVQPWTSVGVATSASTTSATFVVGTVYYVSVRAVDGAGNVSAPSTSDGTEVRLIVTDGTVSGVDIQYQASTETFAADWTALAAGLGPDVVGFEWRIETSDYTPVTNWQTVGLATSASAAGLSLTPGGTYVARVGAVNQDTSVSPIAVSDGVTIDPYAPGDRPHHNRATITQCRRCDSVACRTCRPGDHRNVEWFRRRHQRHCRILVGGRDVGRRA
ncbi:MAG: B-box zinc finger protein [Acidimicrobiia bacterium]|nr:B-box zinc finger protein [Acidimicrobiia bacterium]